MKDIIKNKYNDIEELLKEVSPDKYTDPDQLDELDEIIELLKDLKPLIISIKELEKMLREERKVEEAVQLGSEHVKRTPLPEELPAPGNVNFQTSRLLWDKTRKKVQSELQKLEKAILTAVKEHNEDEDLTVEFEMNEVVEGTKNLYRILDALDTRLIDKLDQALSAEGKDRDTFNRQAKVIIKEYKQFVGLNPLMAVIDDNDFYKVSVRKDVDKALGILASKI